MAERRMFHTTVVESDAFIIRIWRGDVGIGPFAVPDKIFGLTHFLDFIDRGTHCACP